MRLAIIGDTHGEFHILRKVLIPLALEISDTILQVGDFGFWPVLEPGSGQKNSWKDPGVPIRWIDGNHEYFPQLPLGATEPVEVWPNAVYMPRGYIWEIEGKKIGFIGGADSADRYLRKEHLDWFRQERVLIERLEGWWTAKPQLDLLVTHTPPFEVCKRLLGLNPADEFSYSAKAIETIWDRLGRPRLISGHLHKSYDDGRVRVLTINEVAAIDLI